MLHDRIRVWALQRPLTAPKPPPANSWR
jgi:hypothetical protein